MTNIHATLSKLRRPKILINAARLGMADYDRNVDLRFIVRSDRTPSHGDAIETLLAREGDLESGRKSGTADYSIQEHIRVLTALLAEVRLPGITRKAIAP